MAETQELTYSADGMSLRSTLYHPTGGTRATAAVLVFPEAPGLGSYVHGRAAQLADLGYPALACDLHGDATLLSDPDVVVSTVLALRADPGRMRARANGALDAASAALALEPSRIAAIGYCFGGAMALELGRSGATLAGIVGFHCTLATQSDPAANRLSCPVLACVGAEDPIIDVDERRAFEAEMRSFGIDWQLHVYGNTLHGFTNPDVDKLGRLDALRYNAVADARSWQAMLGFFGEVFGES